MYVRKPIAAGRFYSDDPDELKKDILSYIESADIDRSSFTDIKGVIAPHAGYIYSGPVAGFSYAVLELEPVDTVVVFAPSHRYRFENPSFIPSGFYETPLGKMPIDDSVGEVLLESSAFSFFEEAHAFEHSLEVQVPFLQVVQPDAKLLPVVLGSHSVESLRRCTKLIYEAGEQLGKKVAVVMSTDLSHYHSYEKARELDSHFIDAVERYDINSVIRSCSDGSAAACGEAAVVAGFLLTELMGGKKVEFLSYMNSGDTAGPKNEVVGYMAAAITGSEI